MLSLVVRWTFPFSFQQEVVLAVLVLSLLLALEQLHPFDSALVDHDLVWDAMAVVVLP